MIRDLFAIFFEDSKIEFIKETFNECVVKASGKKILLIDSTDLEQKFSKFPKYDKLLITLYKNDISYGTLNNSVKDTSDDFITSLTEFYENKEGNIQIKLTISKNFSDNSEISIYNFDLFIKLISEMTIEKKLIEFQNIKKENDVVNFLIFNEIREMKFGSKTFKFYTPESKFELAIINREDIIKKRNLIANYVNSEKYDFVPEDFKWIVEPTNKKMCEVFNDFTILFSIIYLSDYSRFYEDIISIHLVGYKTIKHKIKDFRFSKDLLQYYEIYKWVYDSGNLSDKIGIARNLISLHISSNDITKIDDNIFTSIKANFRLYLKENTKNFIDLRNRIADNLQSFHRKSSDLIVSFTDNFKKNLFGLTTFYITVLIMTVITGGKLNNIFTKDITYISLAIIILSIIILVYSLIEYKRKKIRFDNQFQENIRSYKYLLTEKEIDEIFCPKISLSEEFKDIDKERNAFIAFWISSLLVLLTLTLILGNWK